MGILQRNYSMSNMSDCTYGRWRRPRHLQHCPQRALNNPAPEEIIVDVSRVCTNRQRTNVIRSEPATHNIPELTWQLVAISSAQPKVQNSGKEIQRVWSECPKIPRVKMVLSHRIHWILKKNGPRVEAISHSSIGPSCTSMCRQWSGATCQDWSQVWKILKATFPKPNAPQSFCICWH